MSIAKILLKLARTEQDEATRERMEQEAVERERENVALFEVTCGEDSPLTASALKGLGEALLRCRQIPEAIESFAKSYRFEAQKDAFDLLAVMEVHNSLFGAHMAAMRTGGELDRPAFRSYMPTIDIALGRVRAMPQDANAGAYYKVAGELRAFAEDYAGAAQLLGEAAELFKTEEEEKVASMIVHCVELKDFCERQLKQQQAAASAQGGQPSEGDAGAGAPAAAG
uniref:KIF-binding protein n=1 Tax=Alexandrium andersonii TaxID=327968 RepID=A0A7S2ISE5_9DINO|mmetsp:Transcript_88092/g.196964  ORF Transcript_88092/g.196964 Transcript_88092/m.196964 type:complete len:226 (+) Transcript_88092:1-678(+)